MAEVQQTPLFTRFTRTGNIGQQRPLGFELSQILQMANDSITDRQGLTASMPRESWRFVVRWLNVTLLATFAGYVFGIVWPSTIENAPIGGLIYNSFASAVESVPFFVTFWSIWKCKEKLFYFPTTFRIIAGFVLSLGLFFVTALLNPDFRAFGKQMGISWF